MAKLMCSVSVGTKREKSIIKFCVQPQEKEKKVADFIWEALQILYNEDELHFFLISKCSSDLRTYISDCYTYFSGRWIESRVISQFMRIFSALKMIILTFFLFTKAQTNLTYPISIIFSALFAFEMY